MVDEIKTIKEKCILTLAEPKILKSSIDVIGGLMNEVTFKLTKEGMQLVALDPANVAMLIFKMKPSAFTEFKVPQDTTIGINVENLKAILRRTKEKDVVRLEIGDKLEINILGDVKKQFSIPLMDIEEKEQKIPELSFKAEVKTTAKEFTDAIDDVEIVAESCMFLCKDDKFYMNAQGDLSKAEVLMGTATKVVQKENNIKSKYAIEYLKKIAVGGKVADNVTIQFSNDFPLRVDFNSEKLELGFILAPRVEND